MKKSPQVNLDFFIKLASLFSFLLFLFFFFNRLAYQHLYFPFFVVFINLVFLLIYRIKRTFFTYLIFSSFFLFCIIEIGYILIKPIFSDDTIAQLAKDIETKEQKIINNEYGEVFMKSQFYGDGIRSLTLFPNHSSKSLTTNSLGFRGQNFQDKVKKRIVFMGGSAAFGWQSSSNETAPAKILEKKLKKNGFDYDVISLAIPTGNSAMDLNMMVPYLLQLNPDIVVFLTGTNDLNGSVLYYSKLASDQTEELHGKLSFNFTLYEIYDNTRILILRLLSFSTLIEDLIGFINKKDFSFGEITPEDKLKQEKSKEIYINNMNLISTFLNKLDIKTMIFHQPLSSNVLFRLSKVRELSERDQKFFKIFGEDTGKLPKTYNVHLKNIEELKLNFNRFDIRYIDTTPLFDQWNGFVRGKHFDDKDALFISHSHLSLAGIQIVTEKIFNELLKEGFLKNF